MKQMWAPWRMDYIHSIKSDGCFMCEIFRQDDDRTNLVVCRGDTCGIVMNRYPYSNGHLMVSPYRHIDTLESLTQAERTEMMDLSAVCTTLLTKIMQPQGFNIGINLGEVAGAGLKDHIHLHVVPRWNGDTNFMPVFGETKVIPQALDDVWNLLQQELSS